MTAHVPRKRFGQHFLCDDAIVRNIIAAVAPRPEDVLVEIGPGPGVLTAPLLRSVPHLHVVEIDRDLAAALRQRYAPEQLDMHVGDVLDFDFATLPPSLRLVGNLPYNISTELLFRMLPYAARIRDAHFMLQLEVVDRMVASPGTSAYGRLSVMLQYRYAMEKLFEVPPEAFRPPPKVRSAVIRMRPKEMAALTAPSDQTLGRVVTAAFTKRRKTLRNALEGVVSAQTMSELGIDPGLRPENLSVEDFVRLSASVRTTGQDF